MTQEEKLLLTKDLCGRLPYGVKCYVPVENCTMELTGKRLNYFCFHKDVWGIDYSHEFEVVLDPLNDTHNGYVIKPYLRPMSSMTEEERKEYNEYLFHGASIGLMSNTETACELIDWLNKKMFDYRGLIPMHLALEAPEGMYNIIKGE
jgi:hypothetical protein